MEVIRVRNASKSFHEHKVLNDVSLSCQKDKIYGIVGYNGSGKTVLFKCICGLYYLDEGQIWIQGKQMKKRYRYADRSRNHYRGTGISVELYGIPKPGLSL